MAITIFLGLAVLFGYLTAKYHSNPHNYNHVGDRFVAYIPVVMFILSLLGLAISIEIAHLSSLSIMGGCLSVAIQVFIAYGFYKYKTLKV